ncbi:MAG: HDIG domain-containing protein [Chloroflexi bacterium]|nr:HDIG domain-containing protein [Chloroflexota bacterium]
MSSVSGSLPRQRRSRTRARQEAPRSALRIAGVFGLLSLVVWGLLSVNIVPLAVEVREGEVSLRNISSPRKLTYTSPVLTKAEREKAAERVQEVVEIDPSMVQRQRAGLNSLLQSISAARNAPGQSIDQRKGQLSRLGQPPLEEPSITALAALDDARWYSVSSEAQRLLWEALKDKLPEWRVSEVVRELPLRVSDQLTESERLLAVDLASRFVGGNLVPNKEATQRLRKEAEEAVAPVQVTVERDETVLREGQVVGAADIEKLDLLGLRNPTTDWRKVGAAAAFAVLTMSMIAAYIVAFHQNLATQDRSLGLIALLVIVTVVSAKFVLPSFPILIYAFPLPAVAMLIATLIDGRLAIVIGALLGVLVGFVAGTSLEAATLALATSVVAAGAVWRRERLHVFFVAGLLVALTQIAVVVAFQLAQRGEDVWTLARIAAFCGVNGVVSSTLALGATYVLGRLFGITTTMQLLELANPTQPLLRRLLMEAPGTYHHSIMVGNLAERAAEEVGADPLLVRVGAYYHDIGKLRRPYFFVENQAGGENVHETLEPEVSADIVRAHVRDGVELCEQYGVPPAVRELIPQHHGTRLVSFFYDQAVDAAASTGQHPPDPQRFKYPGPRPQTKEGAILMMADSVEAAARASRDHSAEAITNLVEKLVMGRVSEGQLDDCDLTLRDVQRIKDAFRAILIGMYHPRIEYPERAPAPVVVAPPAVAGELVAPAGEPGR